MTKSTENVILIGAALAGVGLLAFSGSGTSVLSPGTSLNTATGYPYAIMPGAPAIPTTYNQAYYLAYQYPAMLQANPNVGNPNYVMTVAEAQQYYNNYSQLQQWAATVIPKPFADIPTAMRFHWKTFGVAQQMSFMPFLPTDLTNWTPPPVNKNASSSSSGWLSTALTIATTVASIAAVPPKLNNAEIEVLMNGCAIGLDIESFFFGKTNGLAESAAGKMEDLVKQYAQ